MKTKDKSITIRLSKSEKESIKRRAKLRDMTVSAFLLSEIYRHQAQSQPTNQP
jgi:uncharacterized protein (DUF1778 family)